MPAPNPADFQAQKKEGYDVTFSVRGTVCMTIHASSKEEAKQKAQAMAEDDASDELRELHDIDDVSVDYVREKPTMFLIMRDGKPMQTNHLQEGDLPREPLPHGF